MVILLLALLSQEDANEISGAGQKLAASGSYAYTLDMRMDGGGREGGRGFSGISGAFHRTGGLHVKMGDRGELFRMGESVFSRWGDSEWRKVGEGDRKGGKRGRGRSRSGWMKGIRPPHEDFLRLAEGVSKTQALEDPEVVEGVPCVVREGVLSRESLEKGMVGRMLKRFGAEKEAEVSGSLRGWIGPKGLLRQYRVTTSVKVELQGNPVEFVTTRTFAFSGIGETEVGVPEGLRDRVRTPTPSEPKEK